MLTPTHNPRRVMSIPSRKAEDLLVLVGGLGACQNRLVFQEKLCSIFRPEASSEEIRIAFSIWKNFNLGGFDRWAQTLNVTANSSPADDAFIEVLASVTSRLCKEDCLKLLHFLPATMTALCDVASNTRGIWSKQSESRIRELFGLLGFNCNWGPGRAVATPTAAAPLAQWSASTSAGSTEFSLGTVFIMTPRGLMAFPQQPTSQESWLFAGMPTPKKIEAPAPPPRLLVANAHHTGLQAKQKEEEDRSKKADQALADALLRRRQKDAELIRQENERKREQERSRVHSERPGRSPSRVRSRSRSRSRSSAARRRRSERERSSSYYSSSRNRESTRVRDRSRSRSRSRPRTSSHRHSSDYRRRYHERRSSPLAHSRSRTSEGRREERRRSLSRLLPATTSVSVVAQPKPSAASALPATKADPVDAKSSAVAAQKAPAAPIGVLASRSPFKIRPPPPARYVCTRCDTQGHWLEDCEKYRCHGCGEKGHARVDCKSDSGQPRPKRVFETTAKQATEVLQSKPAVDLNPAVVVVATTAQVKAQSPATLAPAPAPVVVTTAVSPPTPISVQNPVAAAPEVTSARSEQPCFHFNHRTRSGCKWGPVCKFLH